VIHLDRAWDRSPNRRSLSTASISAIRTHIFPVPARELSPAVSMAGGLHWANRGCSSGRCGAHRQIRDGPARPWPAKGPGAHNGDMRRIIGTIVGAIVAVSLAITSVGSIVATLKTFLIVGLIAMAVIIIVWLVARRPRSAVRRD